MTEIVRYEEPPTLDLTPMQQAADYTTWAIKLQSAGAIAREISNTDFVPRALRGKPAAVAAAILAGSEMGLGPMASLMHVHVIEGRPALSAEVARALVLAHGHHIRYREMTTTRCVVEGRRRGEDDWVTVTWHMDDAKAAGLNGRRNWREYPRRMLAARATGELCRMLFADALAGMAYVSEELQDESDDVALDATANGTRTAQRKTATKRKPRQRKTPLKDEPAEPAPADEEPGGEPPLPEDDQPTPDAPITPAQLKKLQAIFTEHKIDRDLRLQISSRIISRDVATAKDLTLAEAGVLIDTLERLSEADDFKGALQELVDATVQADADTTKPEPQAEQPTLGDDQ